MKKTVLLVLITYLIISCEKTMLNTSSDTEAAVVEAFLFSGVLPEIKITRLIPFSDDGELVIDSISGLQVTLEKNSTFYLLQESSPGIYTYLEDGLILSPFDTCGLVFKYLNQTVSATTVVPAKPGGFTTTASNISVERIAEGQQGMPSFEAVDLSWSNPDDSYFIIVIEYMESLPDLINANMAGMDLPLNTSSEPLKVPGYTLNMRNIYFFGYYRIILMKINQEYADLYESISQSSNNLTNPLTNVVNGWGIFTAVNSDTLFLRVKEVK